jgi:hypothetical protein
VATTGGRRTGHDQAVYFSGFEPELAGRGAAAAPIILFFKVRTRDRRPRPGGLFFGI